MLGTIISTLLFFLPFTIMDQSADIDNIISTIENYFDGYIERDINKLNAAFDTENGTMKTPSKSEAGKETFLNKYFKEVIPGWAGQDKLSSEVVASSHLKILNIDVIDAIMATAKIEMKVGDIIYIDLLSIQKMNDQWKITNKMYLVKGN